MPDEKKPINEIYIQINHRLGMDIHQLQKWAIQQDRIDEAIRLIQSRPDLFVMRK